MPRVTSPFYFQAYSGLNPPNSLRLRTKLEPRGYSRLILPTGFTSSCCRTWWIWLIRPIPRWRTLFFFLSFFLTSLFGGGVPLDTTIYRNLSAVTPQTAIVRIAVMPVSWTVQVAATVAIDAAVATAIVAFAAGTVANSNLNIIDK